ncbi:trypsin-like peptidase domain-containing protein [Oerskovia sp. Sa1BUA8]|uniref:Trypsin-like peptidase domain-containing protein n=1 Tax=Oerskovia douganii TaxID=2762210 RepID=A0A9D5UB82_9CELL|nr:trypsin-like peptidase domain-containing protein [Oerskovia douganii]MBE7701899.1 trypsin-like peptidase domain-containing protein [Oerskovia douganii]
MTENTPQVPQPQTPREGDTQRIEAQPTQQLPATPAQAPATPAHETPTQHFAAPHPGPVPAPPAQEQAGPQHAPHGAQTQHGAPTSTPYSAAGMPPAPVAPEQAAAAPRKNRTWIPVVGAAAAAAVLASAGTAGLLTALDGSGPSSSSLASIGENKENSTVPVASSTSENPDWQAVTSAVAPSVVSIQVTTASGSGEGSGVVIDTEGHVLTNNHVVEGAQNDTVQVTLSDGRLYEAKIVGLDPTTDLAVVELVDPPSNLTPATFGDSDDVTVGESVLAVGNPLGLANTATTGIVSALDRPVAASGSDGGSTVVTNAIQIDAAINPGNSGGPLFNAQGEVIGITSSIATTSSQSGSIGLGFAIPVNLAKNISAQLIENGTAEHAFLGVSMTDATATADGVTRRGAEVKSVQDGSPAAEAGIETGDVIVAIDGNPVSGAESLTGFVRERATGDVAKVTVVRDGKTVEVDVTLAAKPTETTTGDQNGSGQDGSGSGQDGSGQQGRPGSGDQGSSGQDESDQTNPNNLPNPFDWFNGQG